MPGSPLAGDDRKSDPYQVSHSVTAAMDHAIEHLHALRALAVDAGALHPRAPFTITRAAIETAAIGVWMLYPPARQERVMRRLRLAFQDGKDSATLEGEIGSTPGVPWEERKPKLNRLAGRVMADPDFELEKKPLSTTEVVRFADSVMNEVPVLTAWRICAGFSHGRLWPTLGVLDRQELPNEGDPAVAHLYVTNNPVYLHFAASTAWRLLDTASDIYQKRRQAYY